MLARGNSTLALAAEAGYDGAIKKLRMCHHKDKLSKSILEEMLRKYHWACKDMKSEERERLDVFRFVFIILTTCMMEQ